MTPAPSTRIVVVGGGTSGAVVAARLSEEPGLDVTLLEAGPDHDSYDLSILDPAKTTDVWSTFAHASMVQMSHPNGPIPMVQGEVLGGTSAINYLATVRGQPSDYDAWQDGGCTGWGWSDVADEFIRAEADRDLGHLPIHGASGPLPIRRWSASEHSRCHTAFADGMHSIGHRAVTDLNDPTQLPGIGVFPATVDPTSGHRMTTSAAYLTRPMRERPNLTVRTGSRVTLLLVDSGRATGVELEDGTVVDADEVIVCCGAITTPALLQRSGIGPASQLRAHGIAVHADLPVGSTLSDHLGPVIPFRHDGPTGGTGGPAQTVLVGASDGTNVDYHMFPTPSGESDDGTTFVMLTFLLRSTGRGSVTLDDNDPGLPPVVVAPPLPEDGPERLDVALHQLHEWIRSDAAQAINCEPTGADRCLPRTASEALDRWTMSYGHMVGSCPMGPVLDAECRVHGISGLRLADASVMPQIPAGNTYLGCVMVAERVAQFVKADMTAATSL